MIRQRVREFTLLLVLLVVAAVSWWMLERAEKMPRERVAVEGREPDAYLTQFVVTAMDEFGRPSQRLQAVRMQHFPRDDIAIVESPLLTLYRTDEAPWYISAERGLIRSLDDTVLLEGQVDMQHEDEKGRSTHVRTRDVLVYPDKHYAETDAAATMVDPMGITQATGLRAYLDDGRLSLLADVRGEYEPSAR